MFENMNDCFPLCGPVMKWPLVQGAFTPWQQGGSTGDPRDTESREEQVFKMDGWVIKSHSTQSMMFTWQPGGSVPSVQPARALPVRARQVRSRAATGDTSVRLEFLLLFMATEIPFLFSSPRCLYPWRRLPRSGITLPKLE